MKKTAIIIGAGPAGLTAAYELLTRTNIRPVILEKSGDIGGISKTVNYKGNRIDIGGHRFFSKSDRVMNWWLARMPIEEGADAEIRIGYQGKSRSVNRNSKDTLPSKPVHPNAVMLVRRRLSRIYFLRQFFTYPLQLSIDTIRKLGFIRTISILLSYLKAQILPRRPEKSLEDFLINRFGKKLYQLFFKDYTEKVWGTPCHKISAEWGAQRIKGINIGKAITHAIRQAYPQKKNRAADIRQKDTETSLIEHFLYPKFGPGQLWELVAQQVRDMGGEIFMQQEVDEITAVGDEIIAVKTTDKTTGEPARWKGDYFFSTMPVKELIAGLQASVPTAVREVAEGLQYRDFITVGILLRQLTQFDSASQTRKPLSLADTWIYIQEKDVKVGRLQLFNNWSPFMVDKPEHVWIGMEYFCDKEDVFWQQEDAAIRALAIAELGKIGFATEEDILDATVLRMEKTYPAYFGTYGRFDSVRQYLDGFPNLFLVGRNGMHKYNNSDHSMLTAMTAVDNIIAGVTGKANLWSINTEQEYHEEKSGAADAAQVAGKRAKFPFWADYLWRNRPNRAWWLTGMVAFLVEFIFFKFHYPFANYMPDSYSYLQTAANNADVNMWPVAYSKFLRLISVFTHSDVVVTGLQYFFMQCCSLLFLFSILYWLKPGRWVKAFLLLFILLNPVPLYLANYISADALFIGLSLLWLSSLLWIIYQLRPWLIVVQAILLLACFTVRYNAIYYPFIAALVLMLSRQSWRQKAWGIALSCVLVGLSVLYTGHKMKNLTGQWQFSAFGGWQMANNALYMYQDIPAGDRGSLPVRFAALESDVRAHMDTLKKIKFTLDDTISARFYLWSGRAPLVHYLTSRYKKDSTTPYFKRWASEGPLYEAYGLYLIRKFPWQFAKYWLLPNVGRFAVPPTEFLGVYNMGADSVDRLAKDWFNYPSRKVSAQNNHNKGKKKLEIIATEWYPAFSAVTNILLLMSLIGMVFLHAVRWKDYGLPQLMVLTLVLWLCNGAFSIFAAPITLRYQAFPILVSTIIGTLLMGKIVKLAFTPIIDDKGIPR